MVRYLLTFVTLAILAGWLVLSYLPGMQATLPAIAFPVTWAEQVLPWLAGLTLAGFVAIQLILLAGTGRLLRQPATPVLAVTAAQFRLRYGREMVLTALPLVMTLALAAVLVRG